MRAIITSVDFGDILSITLPYNRHHFTDVFVVTTPQDHLTMKAANDCGAHILTTELFHAGGAPFAKYAALEWGLDQMGRHGWLCLMDADTMWPRRVPCDEVDGAVPSWYPEAGNLYTPKRRIWPDVTKPVPSESEWRRLRYHHYHAEWSGYTQIFYAKDRHLGPSPWHETDWAHAAGGDSFFQMKWPPQNKLRPPFEVLCLGPDNAQNWCGRSMPYTDGTLPEGAAERQAEVMRMLKARQGKQGPERFADERIKS